MPDSGTEAGMAWGWALAYRELGYRVIVITQNAAELDPSDSDWKQAGIQLIRVGQAAKMRSIPQGSIEYFTATFRYMQWVAATRRVIKNLDNLSLVHHVSWSSVRLPPPTPSQFRGNVIWGPLGGGHRPIFRGLPMRNVVQELFRLATFVPGFLNLIWTRFTRGKRIQALATNRQTLRILNAAGFRNATLELADGLSAVPAKRTAPSSEATIRMVWLGRLVGSKRPDLAIRVAHELASRGESVNLKLAGAGPELDSLQSLVTELTAANYVELLGRVPHGQVGNLYRQTDLVLFCSMRDSSAPVALEAAAHGVPTFGLLQSGLGDLFPNSFTFGKPKFTSDIDFVNEIADLIQNYKTLDSEAQTSISLSAVDFANNQTWGHKLNRILGIS